MPHSPNRNQSYAIFTTTGAATGAGLSQAIGGIGITGIGTGFGLGMMPMIGVGAVVGAAAHEVLRGIAEGDRTVLGAGILGGIGGAGIHSTIGGVGIAFGGGAIGAGLFPFIAVGATVAFAANSLINGAKQKPGERFASASQAFDQMEAKINDQLGWQFDYIQALLELEEELSGEALKRTFRLLEVDIELEEMKAKMRSPSATPRNSTTPPVNETAIASHPELAWHCVHTWKAHDAEINGLAISPDSQTLVSASSDRTINLWRVSTQKRLFSFFCTKEPYAVAIAPDNQTLISGDFDQKVTSWHLTTKAMLQTFFSQPYCPTSHDGFVYAVAISPNHQTVVSGGADNTVRLWKMGSGQPIRILNGHTQPIWSVLIHPDQTTCVSASGDHTIRIWQMHQFANPRILTGHTNSVNAIALNPNGTLLISGSSDTTIKYWDYHTGDLLRTLTGHKAAIFSIAISPDGETLASSDRAGVIKLWNLATGELLQTIANRGYVLFSPDGQFLITSHQGNLKLWQRQLIPNSSRLGAIVDGDWWIVLGVSPDAEARVVKRAYHDLARQNHPDVNRSANAPEIMQILNKAYESFERSQTGNSFSRT